VTNRPKAIGTAAETAVVRALRGLGFPHAERRALTGALDQGDITGCPGVCWEVKGGEAAKTASDADIDAWLIETENERHNADASIGVLVVQRRGVGPANASRWWAVLRAKKSMHAAHHPAVPDFPVRLLLRDAVHLLRAAGYGDPLPEVNP
jgi:hypothetical protein